MHYDLNVENYTIDDVMQNVLNPINASICSSFNINDMYLKKFDEFIEDVLSNQNNINEIDLDVKLAMGLYIRIFLERFLYKFCTDNNINPNISITAKTNSLINSAMPLLNNDNELKKKILNANLIAPAFVHVNSFMYEPIIDVEVNSLIESCQWIHDKNATWPL